MEDNVHRMGPRPLCLSSWKLRLFERRWPSLLHSSQLPVLKTMYFLYLTSCFLLFWSTQTDRMIHFNWNLFKAGRKLQQCLRGDEEKAHLLAEMISRLLWFFFFQVSFSTNGQKKGFNLTRFLCLDVKPWAGRLKKGQKQQKTRPDLDQMPEEI